jgi:hypothetical protein
MWERVGERTCAEPERQPWPNEIMLAPVTEHREFGREDARPPQRRLCGTPEQLLAGGGGSSELVRGERSQSWVSINAPSATPTSHFTAGTSGSVGGGGDRGDDTGVDGVCEEAERG